MSFTLEIKTAEDVEAEAQAARIETLKAECRARIFAVADTIAQMNLAAAAGAGLLSAGDMATYQSGLGWIGEMRANIATLVQDQAADPASDASWPDVPAGVKELADRY